MTYDPDCCGEDLATITIYGDPHENKCVENGDLCDSVFGSEDGPSSIRLLRTIIASH